MPTDNKWEGGRARASERSVLHLGIALFGLPCQRPSFSLPFPNNNQEPEAIEREGLREAAISAKKATLRRKMAGRERERAAWDGRVDHHQRE